MTGARRSSWPWSANSSPGIVVNDRSELPGDVATPEQYQPAGTMRLEPSQSLWEANQTLNGSFGYERDNLDWKPPGKQR